MRRWSKSGNARPSRSSSHRRSSSSRPTGLPPRMSASACSMANRRACASMCWIRIGLAPGEPHVDAGPRTGRILRSQGAHISRRRHAGRRRRAAGDPRVFVFGEDVGGKYGNAFLLLRPLLEEFGDRIMNSPISESAILGVAVGSAIAGQRPIVEMQFNDFVATGFNQLVNNAAKIRYRWGGSVPMVVRMPWGGLRHAGPFHSQNTEAWFYRTPGLKIVVPSTPADARALMAAAVADPDPVLYYEHIALYRDPRIKQSLPDEAPAPIPIGRAALRRAGHRYRDHFVRRVRARGAARRRTARRRRPRGGRARSSVADAARSRARSWRSPNSAAAS